ENSCGVRCFLTFLAARLLGAALAPLYFGNIVVHGPTGDMKMAQTNVGRVRILRAARLTITLAVLAIPRLCLAQDDRTDDPPERRNPLQPSGLVGASGGSGPGGGSPGPGGGSPGPVGTTGQAGTTTATPITGLFTEPKILTKGINFALDKFDTDHQRNKD